MGFWQGVDVPGPSLSLVTIDRLPFPRPDDPLLRARRAALGAAAFELIDVPRAATLLAQGAGRLVRSRQDRGVVAVLDRRLGKARYRWELVNALPPMRDAVPRRGGDVPQIIGFRVVVMNDGWGCRRDIPAGYAPAFLRWCVSAGAPTVKRRHTRLALLAPTSP